MIIRPNFAKFSATWRGLAWLGAVFLAGFACFAQAGETSPDWPCIQPKVGAISLGQMWPLPVDENAALSEDGARLASILSLRRVTDEEAKGYVEDYAAAHEDTAKDDMGVIYDKVLQNINVERDRIIGGIARYAEGQQARSQSIDELRVQMKDEEAKDEPDFDRLDQLEEQLDWDERIHRDREQSLTFVCETPVILEKRAYSLAQIMLPFAQ